MPTRVGGSLSWGSDRLVLLCHHLSKFARTWVSTTPWPETGGGRTMGPRETPPMA